MENNILLELRRIKNLMGVDKTNSLNLIFEDPMGAEIRQRAIDKGIIDAAHEGTSVMDKKQTINIGKDTDYPFIYYQGVPEFDTFPVVEGSKIYTIKPDTTSNDLIDGVQVGTVINEKGEEVQNQEYIVKKLRIKKPDGTFIEEDKKLCLPTKDFWNLPQIQGKVYKFRVPVNSSGSGFSISGINRSNKQFAMMLELKKTQSNDVNAEGKEIKQTSLQASIKCNGGDNGWGFVIKPPLFFNVETREGYNPKNPEDLDDRSEWEVWYSHYGGWLEVGIGVAASFVGAGLASFLLEMAEFAGASGAFFRFMSSTYAGGSTTWASVFLQVITEGVMMKPIIDWQLANSKEDDAMLNSLFLLIPFVSETKAVSKFIGGKYSKETAKNLSEKMSNVGLKRIFDMAKAGQTTAVMDFQAFVNSLTGTELVMFQEGMAMFAKKEGMDAFKEGFQELVKSGGALEKEWLSAQSKAAQETVLGKLGTTVSKKTGINANKVSKTAAKYFNPFTAKTLLPGQFTRMGVPIAIVAASFKMGYKALKQEEQIKFNTNLTGWTDNSEYITALTTIDPYFVELTTNKTLEKITSNEEMARKYVNNIDWSNDPELKQIYDQAGKEVIEQKSKEYVSMLGPEFQSGLATLRLKMSYMASCKEKLSLIGLTIKKWDSMNEDLRLSTATIIDKSTNEYKLEIRNNNGKIEYYIDGVLVPQTDFDNNTWKPKTK
jgi:hypothetical protein